MSTGLSPTRVVNIGVNFAPIAAASRNFGAAMIVGPSNVIPMSQRYRSYSALSGVAGDFSVTSPEYLAALKFFAQSPQPSFCFIGRWAQAASTGMLTSGYIAPNLQAAFLATVLAITTGGMHITLGGTVVTVTALSFAAATPSMAGLAAALDTALGAATCIWDSNNNQFVIGTAGTGVSAGAITYGSANTGIDLSVQFQLTQALGASLSQGVAAETPIACYQAIASMSNAWYGFMFAPVAAADISHSDYLAVANSNEAQSPVRIFGVNTMEPGTVDPNSSTDLAFLLKQANLERTCCQYSSSDQYAICSLFGRAFTVDFTANNSTITLKFKQEPAEIAETINTTQADALKAKNCNVFVNYSNSTAIIQEGVMCNGFFFDEVQGTDWLASDQQTRVYNRLYTALTKVPQTDAGNHELVNECEASCVAAVNNGLVAPGVWNGPPIGPIVTGQYLPAGYFVYAPPVASQSQADREARKAVPIQTLIKLAGAIHFSNCLINVNR